MYLEHYVHFLIILNLIFLHDIITVVIIAKHPQDIIAMAKVVIVMVINTSNDMKMNMLDNVSTCCHPSHSHQ